MNDSGNQVEAEFIDETEHELFVVETSPRTEYVQEMTFQRRL